MATANQCTWPKDSQIMWSFLPLSLHPITWLLCPYCLWPQLCFVGWKPHRPERKRLRKDYLCPSWTAKCSTQLYYVTLFSIGNSVPLGHLQSRLYGPCMCDSISQIQHSRAAKQDPRAQGWKIKWTHVTLRAKPPCDPRPDNKLKHLQENRTHTLKRTLHVLSNDPVAILSLIHKIKEIMPQRKTRLVYTSHATLLHSVMSASTVWTLYGRHPPTWSVCTGRSWYTVIIVIQYFALGLCRQGVCGLKMGLN